MQGLRGERHAVVGADRVRKAVVPERALEHGLCHEGLGREQPLTGQQVARVLIGDRERIAIHAIPRAELPFEIGGP